jgi:hypothetical protein
MLLCMLNFPTAKRGASMMGYSNAPGSGGYGSVRRFMRRGVARFTYDSLDVHPLSRAIGVEQIAWTRE